MLTVNEMEVQKHQLKGPVGYSMVGNPTIVDGVVSGFSSRDYLTISKPTLNTNDFEFKTCFTPGNSANQRIITTMSGSTTRSGFVIDFSSHLNACFYNATEVLVISSNTSLVANTKYYAIMYRQGTTIGLKLSTDNQTWENVTQTILATDSIVLSDNLGIGRSSQSTFTGSINLNETYIKINGKLWFYQPADTKYIVKDGKLVWADPRIALSGPVDYTVVGNPTIIDGVASGFSSSDYLGFSSDLNDMASANSWEVVIRFTHKTVSAFRAFLGNTGSNFSSFGVNIANKLRLGLFDDSTTVADILSTTVLQDSQSYYAKFIYDSTEGYKMYLSTDGTTYTLENSSSNTAKFKSQGTWKMGFVYSNPFPGSIDLNETYIKVNDQLWFYGKNYATQNIAPVPAGYTFGNTTTPSIGYVDMRTQQFTAAPQGATIGRDE